MTLSGLARVLVVAMMLVSAPLMILWGLEVYGAELDPAVEVWLMVVRGWFMGLVMTGSLALLPELWLRLREPAHRWVVGLIYGAGLGVHALISTPVLASKLVGDTLKETLTAKWLEANWIAFTWVGVSIVGFDLLLLGLVLSVGLLRPSEGQAETLGEYEGSPEEMEAEAMKALHLGAQRLRVSGESQRPSEGLGRVSAEGLPRPSEGLPRVYEAKCTEAGCGKVFASTESQREADEKLNGHKSWHARKGNRGDS